MGAFPSASELAPLTAEFLAQRCGLGYRAQRVLTFAQGVASGQFDLGTLEAHQAVIRQATVAEHGVVQELGSEGAAGPGAVEQLSPPPEPVGTQRGRGRGAAARRGSQAQAQSQSEAGRAPQQAPSSGREVVEDEDARDACIEDLRQKILELPGFGPYSAANVLQCLGIYSLVPSDSETVRHLKQVPCGTSYHGSSRLIVTMRARMLHTKEAHDEAPVAMQKRNDMCYCVAILLCAFRPGASATALPRTS